MWGARGIVAPNVNRLIGSEILEESMSADRPKIRGVFDCMVLLQGRSPRKSCLLLVELTVIELCLFAEIIAEVRDVLARPRVHRQFPALTGDVIDQFVAAPERQALVIPEVESTFACERDPKDEPYINLEIAAGAGTL